MLSGLCRQFQSTCSLSSTRARQPIGSFMSTQAAAIKPQEERVESLRLNMLQDNPGAVRKVRLRVICHSYSICVSLYPIWGSIIRRVSVAHFFVVVVVGTPYWSRYRFQQGKDKWQRPQGTKGTIGWFHSDCL